MILDDDKGGFDGDLSRADLDLIRQALRQDWPIPPKVKTRVLQRLVNILDPETNPHEKTRNVIAAARALAAFGGLNIQQAKLDLLLKRLDGDGEKSALDLVVEAERRALEMAGDDGGSTAAE